MAGAGTVGVGGVGSGVGVGGWQLYEQVINPTLDTQLSWENYQYRPARVPLSDTPSTDTNNKYNGKSWGCVDKLFPELKSKIKHDNLTTPTQTATSVSEKATSEIVLGNTVKQYYYGNKPDSVSDKFVTCALPDKRDGSNKVYFKSEVAVRDEKHGWIMGNGLSTKPDNSDKVTFEYRLLTLKKTNDAWEVDKGFGWDSPSEEKRGESLNRLKIKIPAGQWRSTPNVGRGYSSRNTGSGVAVVDSSSSKHLLESLEIYMAQPEGTENQQAEFFGEDDGQGNEITGGYQKANRMYVANQGGSTLEKTVELRYSLEEGYKPFMEKKVRWTTCDEWSYQRRSPANMSETDKSILDLCYTQSK